ncbi:MAG: hypothetical protein V5A44_12445 [Haloarculaceae archaeon]
MQGRRLVLGCVLLAVLFGLAVHYGANVDAHERYPDNEDVATAHEDYVGQTVRISGTVRATTANASGDERPDASGEANGTMTIVLRQFESFGALTVRGADRTAPPGGTVQVIGTLEPDRRVTAERVLPVNARSWSEPYKYAVSVVGAVLVLVAFFREWRVDVEALAFEVRDDG